MYTGPGIASAEETCNIEFAHDDGSTVWADIPVEGHNATQLCSMSSHHGFIDYRAPLSTDAREVIILPYPDFLSFIGNRKKHCIKDVSWNAWDCF